MAKLGNQKGFAIAQVLVALSLMGALGGVSFLYNQNQKIGFNKNLVTTAGTVLTQISTTLMTDISAQPPLLSNGIYATMQDTSSVNVGGENDLQILPLAGDTLYSGTDGFKIPVISSAQKLDPWGTPILYCPYDNGTGTAGTNTGYGTTKYITGDTPSTQSNSQNYIVFAIVSAGPDKTFQTTCANARVNARGGDDGYRLVKVSNMLQGVGGTVYYKDPTNLTANLNNISGKFNGQSILTLDTNMTYTFNSALSAAACTSVGGQTALVSGCWVPVTPKGTTQTAGTACDGSSGSVNYGAGAMATDSSGNVLVCKP